MGQFLLAKRHIQTRYCKSSTWLKQKGVSTPATHKERDNHKDVSGKVPYREAVGSLMYLAAATRPDIAFTVNKAARVMDRLAERTGTMLNAFIRCLRSTSNYGLRYTRGSGELKMFSDADFAGDNVTIRSTTCVTAIFADGAMSWTSQLQKKTALSTTEAEIIAASEEAKELVWLKHLLSELLSCFARKTPVLYINNTSAIKLTKNPEYHKSRNTLRCDTSL